MTDTSPSLEAKQAARDLVRASFAFMQRNPDVDDIDHKASRTQLDALAAFTCRLDRGQFMLMAQELAFQLVECIVEDDIEEAREDVLRWIEPDNPECLPPRR